MADISKITTLDGITYNIKDPEARAKIVGAVAPDFDPNVFYSAGDTVYYNNVLCRFVNDHSGAWEAEDAEEVPPLPRAIDELTAKTKDLEEKKADRILATASGEVASFDDGAEAKVIKVVTDISPIQDLNGYDRPWPAGGGKNLLPMTISGIKAANTSGTWTGDSYAIGGVTFTIEKDYGGNVTGIRVNGTAVTNAILIVGNVSGISGTYILSGCPANGSYASKHSLNLTPFTDDGTGVNVNAEEITTGNIGIRVATGYNASNLLFKPMLRISSVSDATFAPYSNICPIGGVTAVHVWLAPERPKTYGVKWDGTTPQMTRYGDAAGITTDTSHFNIQGAASSSYSNPFDSIYPWSDRKLCNISLSSYMALTSDDELQDCVTKWEGGSGFSYDDSDGVWVYTPPFWGRSYVDDSGNFCYEVSDKPQKGFLAYPEMITARWRGVVETRTIGGSSKSVLLPKPGMPGKRIAMSTLHSYAKNYGGSVTTIYSIDASYLLMFVEYANFNCRVKVGGGVNSVYRENSDHFVAASTSSTTVSIAKTYTVLPNAIFDIGTSNGGVQVGSYTVTAVDRSGDNQVVTLDRAVTVTTDHFWSVHGMVNTADSVVGGKSGYVGNNNQSHAYYRGEELWGNLFMYCLGAYKQANTNHVWLCPLSLDPDNYSAINTTAHVDTGVSLSTVNGYQKMIAAPNNKATNLAAAILTTEAGSPASATTPIGSYYYVSSSANTIPFVGGRAGNGSIVGLYWHWGDTASTSSWACGASPRLKSPKGVVRGSALPLTA